MGTEWQPRSTRARQEAAPDPGELVRELEEAVNAASADEELAGTPDYCSFCWTVLPAAALECPDCGRTVAEMEAARAAVAEADRRWSPPRLSEDDGGYESPGAYPTCAAIDDYEDLEDLEEEDGPPVAVAPEPAAAAGKAGRAPSTPRLQGRPSVGTAFGWRFMRGSRQVVLGVVLTASLFASGFVGQWLAIATFPKSTLDPEKLAEMTARMPARLRWRRFSPDLRVILATRNGEEVARSTEGNQSGGRRIRPGAYCVRVTDKTRTWTVKETEVTAKAGRSLLVGPSPEQEAAYHLWKAERLLAQRKPAEARAHLEKARRLAPRDEQTQRRVRSLAKKAA